MWGTVEGVRIDISDQASITIAQGTGTELVNLWQQNMFAVRAEIEVGFICQDTYFNGLTRTHAS
jgi:hypothetical protein